VTELQKKTYKHHVFAPTAGAHRCDLPQTLHDDRARRAHEKSCHSFFDPTRSFSYRMHGKIRPNWRTHGFSAIPQ